MKINKHVFFALFLSLIFLSGGTFYFHSVENWSPVDSFYFSTMTLTTIGYGDFVPTMDESKIFVSIYAILGVGIMLYLLGSIIAAFLVDQEDRFFKVVSKLDRRQKKKKKKFS